MTRCSNASPLEETLVDELAASLPFIHPHGDTVNGGLGILVVVWQLLGLQRLRSISVKADGYFSGQRDFIIVGDGDQPSADPTTLCGRCGFRESETQAPLLSVRLVGPVKTEVAEV